MRKFRTYHEVESLTGDKLVQQVVDQRERLERRLGGVQHLVAIASGKGGVGKSAVTANLAAALAVRGLQIGVVDADLNGPSLARMLDVSGAKLADGQDGVVPPVSPSGVRVMSMELLQEEDDAPLRWREPSGDGFLWQSSLETGALREFLSDVAWGQLDFLLIDVPPGTDKITRVLQLVQGLDMALLVTTPSEMSRFVVAKSARLVRQAQVPRVGLVANMTEYLCPDCGHVGPLFPGDGANRLAESTRLDVWARVPFDPRMSASTDRGTPMVLSDAESRVGRVFADLATRVVDEAAHGRRRATAVEPGSRS